MIQEEATNQETEEANMKHSRLGVVVAALLALLAGPQKPAEAAFVFGYQDRLIEAEAGASDLRVPPYFATTDRDANGRTGGADYGLFDEVVQRDISFGQSQGHGRSHQRSEANATSIWASGEMTASASTTADPGWGGGSGYSDNRFDLSFGVDSAGLYELTTALNHAVSGEVLYNVASSHLSLTPVLGPAIVDRWLATDPGGTQTIQVQLEPGVTYRALIEFIIGGTLSPDSNDGASFTHTADYSFQLTSVPEPATLSLLALGGLAMIRRRRRVGRAT